jgi:hypothetical protein
MRIFFFALCAFFAVSRTNRRNALRLLRPTVYGYSSFVWVVLNLRVLNSSRSFCSWRPSR